MWGGAAGRLSGRMDVVQFPGRPRRRRRARVGPRRAGPAAGPSCGPTLLPPGGLRAGRRSQGTDTFACATGAVVKGNAFASAAGHRRRIPHAGLARRRRCASGRPHALRARTGAGAARYRRRRRAVRARFSCSREPPPRRRYRGARPDARACGLMAPMPRSCVGRSVLAGHCRVPRPQAQSRQARALRAAAARCRAPRCRPRARSPKTRGGARRVMRPNLPRPPAFPDAKPSLVLLSFCCWRRHRAIAAAGAHVLRLDEGDT